MRSTRYNCSQCHKNAGGKRIVLTQNPPTRKRTAIERFCNQDCLERWLEHTILAIPGDNVVN